MSDCFDKERMNVPRERNLPGKGRSENQAKLSQSYPGVKKVIAAGYLWLALGQL